MWSYFQYQIEKKEDSEEEDEDEDDEDDDAFSKKKSNISDDPMAGRYQIKSVHILKIAPKFFPYIYISAKAQEMKAMAEQGLNAAKDKCKVQ